MQLHTRCYKNIILTGSDNDHHRHGIIARTINSFYRWLTLKQLPFKTWTNQSFKNHCLFTHLTSIPQASSTTRELPATLEAAKRLQQPNQLKWYPDNLPAIQILNNRQTNNFQLHHNRRRASHYIPGPRNISQHQAQQQAFHKQQYRQQRQQTSQQNQQKHFINTHTSLTFSPMSY